MKKIILTILSFAFILVVCSCKAQPDAGNDKGGQTEQVQQSTEKDGSDEKPSRDEEPSLDFDDGMQEIQAILDGSKYVLDYESLELVSLFDLGAVNDNFVGKPSRYAVTEPDENGFRHLVVEFSLTDTMAHIKQYNGAWTVHRVSDGSGEEYQNLNWQNF